MKLLFVGFLSITILTAFVFFGNSKPLLKLKAEMVKPLEKKSGTANNESKLAKKYAVKLKPYLKQNNFCEAYCFLIDMRIPSGKKRFFVYDLNKDSILHAGLVTHGGGSETNTDALAFNNTPNGNATSLGKYKIGIEYSGKFGMAFKLHGLESSNSKAFDRYVVLHGHSCVPTQAVDPFPICTSLGCPTVSPSFLPVLKKYIDKADKPVVLWIYY